MRYLVVGLGNVGQKRRALLGARCVATVDPYNPQADYLSPDACAPDRYDAAVLAVPNQAKLALLAYFLAYGKHVLVEKPLLFPDRVAAEHLAGLAAEHGAIWYTSYNHRFEPLIGALRARLEAGTIGRLYHGRLFYGNGTVGNVVGTWRDGGLGVVEDLGSHLLDLAGYLLGYQGQEFLPWALQRHEAAGYDRAVLASADGRLVLETSFVCWKNAFEIDLYGERGSLHLHGLRKWGGSELVVRERVYPSGVPRETRETDTGPDVTWERDLMHFEAQVAAGRTSLENDRWISKTLQRVAGP